MNLAHIRDPWIACTDAKNHPYVNQAARLFVAGTTMYCILKSAGEKKPFYAAAVMSVVERIRSVVCCFLTEKACKKMARSDLMPVIGPVIDYVLLSKLSGLALTRLGVPILEWKTEIAYFIFSDILSCFICPSESQIFSVCKQIYTGELKKTFNDMLKQAQE